MSKHKIINAVLFQAIWVICVYGASQGIVWQACVLTLCFLLWEVAKTTHRTTLVWITLQITIVGCVLDTVLLQSGLVFYKANTLLPFIAPLWILCLWTAFALTLNQSLSWLHGYIPLSAVLGGILGPFSYWIAYRFWDAIDFKGEPTHALILIGCLWGIATPLSLKISAKMQSLMDAPENTGLES